MNDSCRLRLTLDTDAQHLIVAEGELDYGNCDRFATTISGIVKNVRHPIILSLGGLDFVDSSGLRILVKAAQEASLEGLSISIASLSPQLKHLLEISGFISLFKISPGVLELRSPHGAYSAGDREITFKVMRSLSSCHEARQHVCGFACKCGIDTTTLDDIRLAIGEAVSNAVRHGGSVDGEIEIRCRVEEDLFTAVLRYPSLPFDPRRVPTPDLSAHVEGGMGIYFMRLVMDKVQYEFADGYVILLLERRIGSPVES